VTIAAHRPRPTPANPQSLAQMASKNFLAIRADARVADAIAQVRRNAPRGDIFYLYVVDEQQRLKGVISIRNLLMANDETEIEAITSPNIVFLSVDLPVRDAYRIFSESRFLSLPVVDEDGAIQGVVHAHQLLGEPYKTVESLFEERSRGQMFELLGVQAEDSQTGFVKTALGRFPWLLINIVGGAFSAFFIERMGNTLPQAVLYLAFIPILLVVSESVGMQTASVTLDLLNRTGGQRTKHSLLRQLNISTILGALSAITIAGALLLWQGSSGIAMVLGLSLFLGTIWVSLLGTLIPLLIHKLRIDPQIAAGPVVLALADCSTLVLYLGIALFATPHP
jgi:magnesium transporter